MRWGVGDSRRMVEGRWSEVQGRRWGVGDSRRMV